MTYRILLEGYIVVTAFLLAWNKDEFIYDYTFWERFAVVPMYCIVWPIGYSWYYIGKGLKLIDKYTALGFWWDFYLTDKWDILEPHQLRTHHNICKNHRSSNSLFDRYWRFCIRKVFERNKYNPETDIVDTEF